MKKHAKTSSVLLLVFFAFGCAYQEPAIISATKSIEDAAQTIEEFRAMDNLSPVVHDLSGVSSVGIFPDVRGLSVSPYANRKSGIIVTRLFDENWSGPAFHNFYVHEVDAHHTSSKGALVLLFKSRSALQAVLQHQSLQESKTGVQLVYANPETDLPVDRIKDAEILVLSKLPMHIDGLIHQTNLKPNVVLNEALYGPGATVNSILFGDSGNPATNHHPSAELRLRKSLN